VVRRRRRSPAMRPALKKVTVSSYQSKVPTSSLLFSNSQAVGLTCNSRSGIGSNGQVGLVNFF
jgi:hypothetical protein